MPFVDGIRTVTSWAANRGSNGGPTAMAAGQQPGAPDAAHALRVRFGGVFQNTFQSGLATVFERGAAGEFDDPTLRLQEEAAVARLKAAQGRSGATTQPTTGGSVTGGGPPADAGTVEGGGANAAPSDVGAGANAGPSDGAAGAAEVAAPATPAGTDEQREVYSLRIQQSEARLHNISASLAEEFPKAADLVSASTGTWDPATFQPRTRREAEAFAQRMVIDATESAARLEIIKNQLDSARFEAQTTGSPATKGVVAALELKFARQQRYVDKLAAIVDRASGGQVTDAGQDAMAGENLRDEDDLPVEEIVSALREAGMSEDQVARVVGASELSVEEEKTPGGSPRLKQINESATKYFLDYLQKHLNDLREQGKEDAAERAAENKRLQDRADERTAVRHREDRQRADSAQQQRAQQRQAEFEQWLRKLEAEAAQRSRQAG